MTHTQKWIAGIAGSLVVIGGVILLVYHAESRNAHIATAVQSKENSVSSTASVQAPALGIIYKEMSPNAVGNADRYVLYDMNTQTRTQIDPAKPIAWQGINKNPILYYLQQVSSGSTTYQVTAYNLMRMQSKQVTISEGVEPNATFALSQQDMRVGYCANNENVYYVEDLETGNKTAYPSFGGCVANYSFNAPRFSDDSAYIYYNEPTINDDGSLSPNVKYERLNLTTGTSSDAALLSGPNRRVSADGTRFATMASSHGGINNAFEVLDVSGVPRRPDTPFPTNSQVPVVAEWIGAPNEEVLDSAATEDGKGFVFLVQNNAASTTAPFSLGYYDNATRHITYPIGTLPQEYSFALLGNALSKDLALVYASGDGSRTGADLLALNGTSHVITKVDSNIVPQQYEEYFVKHAYAVVNNALYDGNTQLVPNIPDVLGLDPSKSGEVTAADYNHMIASQTFDYYSLPVVSSQTGRIAVLYSRGLILPDQGLTVPLHGMYSQGYLLIFSKDGTLFDKISFPIKGIFPDWSITHFDGNQTTIDIHSPKEGGGDTIIDIAQGKITNTSDQVSGGGM